MPLLVDNADILSSYEESEILPALEEISAEYDMDIVIVTSNDVDGKASVEYADDFYDNNGYKEDGLILLINLEDREWHISSSGYGQEVLTDDALDIFYGDFNYLLGGGEYSDACILYTKICEEIIIEANEGQSFNFVFSIIISLAVGFVAAFIVTGVMKSQLKSVNKEYSANQYVKEGSLSITSARDFYLYRTVSRIAKPKNTGSGTHVSSSGRSHGGGGGKF